MINPAELVNVRFFRPTSTNNWSGEEFQIAREKMVALSTRYVHVSKGAVLNPPALEAVMWLESTLFVIHKGANEVFTHRILIIGHVLSTETVRTRLVTQLPVTCIHRGGRCDPQARKKLGSSSFGLAWLYAHENANGTNLPQADLRSLC